MPCCPLTGQRDKASWALGRCRVAERKPELFSGTGKRQNRAAGLLVAQELALYACTEAKDAEIVMRKLRHLHEVMKPAKKRYPSKGGTERKKADVQPTPSTHSILTELQAGESGSAPGTLTVTHALSDIF